MSNHTPGPWKAHAGEIVTNESQGDDCDVIALMWIRGTMGINKGNAHLIAAAPDLLKQLKIIVGTKVTWSNKDNARAAIAKAEGR